jgi:hypothetical protein
VQHGHSRAPGFHYLAHGTLVSQTRSTHVWFPQTPDEEGHAEFQKRYLGHKVISAVGPSHKAPHDKRGIVLVWEFQEVTLVGRLGTESLVITPTTSPISPRCRGAGRREQRWSQLPVHLLLACSYRWSAGVVQQRTDLRSQDACARRGCHGESRWLGEVL